MSLDQAGERAPSQRDLMGIELDEAGFALEPDFPLESVLDPEGEAEPSLRMRWHLELTGREPPEHPTQAEMNWSMENGGGLPGAREFVHALESGDFPAGSALTDDEMDFQLERGTLPLPRDWHLKLRMGGDWPPMEPLPEELVFLERHGVHPGGSDHEHFGRFGEFPKVPLGTQEEHEVRMVQLVQSRNQGFLASPVPDMEFGEALDVPGPVVPKEVPLRAPTGAELGR